MSKIVKVGSWRLERSSQNKRTILVKGHGRMIAIDYGDGLHPFFEELFEMGQLPWPFVESPEEFSTRLEHALKEGTVPEAVRNVMIEHPPLILLSTPTSAEPSPFKRLAEDKIVSRGYGGYTKV